MDINQLEVLVAVAQEKSFSRAAEILQRTQPAVSQAIQRLEKEIGENIAQEEKEAAAINDLYVAEDRDQTEEEGGRKKERRNDKDQPGLRINGQVIGAVVRGRLPV